MQKYNLREREREVYFEWFSYKSNNSLVQIKHVNKQQKKKINLNSVIMTYFWKPFFFFFISVFLFCFLSNLFKSLCKYGTAESDNLLVFAKIILYFSLLLCFFLFNGNSFLFSHFQCNLLQNLELAFLFVEVKFQDSAFLNYLHS